MSEEGQVFRGDRAPELSQVEGDSARRKPAAAQTVPTAPAAQVAPQAEAPVDPVVHEAADTPAAAPAAAPEPELKLDVDESQLWHANEALRQRIAQLHSTAKATAHQLDAQEEETRRIEKQLKSL